MKLVTLTIDSNMEVLKFIDTSTNHIFIHAFKPHNYIDWCKSTINLETKITLNNIEVRQMQFDIRTDLNGLENILKLESHFLDIYQFNKPIANSLTIENLPKDNLNNILQSNGLIHHIEIEFEQCFVRSYDYDFINRLVSNHELVKQITYKNF